MKRINILRYPDFIGLGAAKCGTTYLADLMDFHPRVSIPRRKELHYFDQEGSKKGFISWLRYLRNFDLTADYVGEVTPSYMLRADYLARIQKKLPNVHVFIIIRDPYDRAWSHYCHATKHFFKHKYQRLGYPSENLGFEDALRSELPRILDRSFHPRHQTYIAKSLYMRSIEPAHRLFGTRLKVIFFDDLVKNPTKVVGEVLKHCCADTIEPLDIPTTYSASRNSQSYGQPSERALSLMKEYFEPEIDRLEFFFSRSLCHWRR